MENNFWASFFTSLGGVGLIGVLLASWINNRFIYRDREISEMKDRIRSLEEERSDYMLRRDHAEIRKEDRMELEKTITEMRADIKEMPMKIFNMIKQYISN